jgi:hypothetical protein
MNTTAQDAFKTMMREHIAPALRSLGFKGSGPAFYLPSESHHPIIGFLKSKYSRPDVIQFVVNVTAVSKRDWEAAKQRIPDMGDRPPPNGGYFPGKWHWRLGHLMGHGGDYWWRLSPSSDLEKTSNEVVQAIRDYALPMMQRKIPRGAGRPLTPCSAA